VKDFYAILGVSASAGRAEIKRAFRKLAIRFHPDKNPSPEAKSLFQEINEAYDTLDDPDKRALYDARQANPLAEIISEPIRTHRDPAYRRRSANMPPRPRGPSASYILMRDSLKYMRWISRVGLLVSTLFFLDYFLPYHQTEERIREIYAVRQSRSTVYRVVLTETGRKIKFYDFDAVPFYDQPTIRIQLTMLYHTVMSVSTVSQTHTVRLAYMYRSLLFMPIILFLNSLVAILFAKQVEWCFNLNVTCCIWLIMNIILL
jgi:curved DNA-binding protein CbpA